jgi:hypothetical protein
MTKHPFTSKKIKDYISGFDKAFDNENINDSLIIAANDIRGVLIPVELYDALIDSMEPIAEGETAPDNAAEVAEALEGLRFCLAPLAIYHHYIWLQVRISNNGITTYQSNDERVAFKYQNDEAKESLLVRFGVFFKEFIDYLEENIPETIDEDATDIFSIWATSDQKKELDALLIKNYRDFDNYFQTEGSAAFFIRSRIFQQEAFDEINAHIKIKPLLEAEEKDEALIRKLKKALAYLTVSRAVFDWDNYFLPVTIRRSIANETTQKTTYEEVKQTLSAKYRTFAEGILRSIDIQKQADKAAADAPEKVINIPAPEVKKTDKHYFMN